MDSLVLHFSNATKAVPMIIDLRTYTLSAGSTAEYLERYEAHALKIQKEILGNLLGYYVSKTGTLNQLVHLWGFADLQDREERRARLWAHKGFSDFAKSIYPLILKQESVLLDPTEFSPVR